MNQTLSPARAEPRQSAAGTGLPLASPELFWRAKHLRPSPWLVHIPFAFWLTGALRPRVFVQLGLGAGSAYFAFCQSVERHGLDTGCHGVDGGETIPAALGAYNAEQYQEFSQLIPGGSAAALDRFENGGIDLLHVDMALPGPEIEGWTRRLSARAVLLLHGPARDGDSGAAAALDDLRARHATFRFEHGDGLEVILIGDADAGALGRLAAWPPEDPDRAAAMEAFARLGRGHHFECAARAAEDAATALGAARAEIETLRADLATHRSALAARSDQAARAQALLHDRTADLDARTAEMAGLTQRYAAETAALRAEAAASAASLRARFVEIAKLTQLLEARAQPRRPKDGAAERTPGTGAPPLLAYARDLERRHAALLASTSWRATAPVRWTLRRLRGRKPPPAFAPRLRGFAGAHTGKLAAALGASDPSHASAALGTYARDLERRHAALLASETWRAMAPVRWTLRRLKGRKPPPPFVPRLGRGGK